MYAIPTISPLIERGEAPESDAALKRLYGGESLGQAEAEAVFSRLVRGELTGHEIAAPLIALRLKGETIDERIGAARRRHGFRTARLSVRRRLRHRGRRLAFGRAALG